MWFVLLTHVQITLQTNETTMQRTQRAYCYLDPTICLNGGTAADGGLEIMQSQNFLYSSLQMVIVIVARASTVQSARARSAKTVE